MKTPALGNSRQKNELGGRRAAGGMEEGVHVRCVFYKVGGHGI